MKVEDKDPHPKNWRLVSVGINVANLQPAFTLRIFLWYLYMKKLNLYMKEDGPNRYGYNIGVFVKVKI